MNEELYKELIDECERLTNIIDNSEVGDEQWKLAYGKKLDILDKMQEYNKTDSDWMIKSEDRKVLKEHNERMEALEKRRLEIEAGKSELSWKYVAFEAGKILIPLVISIWHYNSAAKKMYDFEEHGRITSTVGKDLHLPKISNVFRK